MIIDINFYWQISNDLLVLNQFLVVDKLCIWLRPYKPGLIILVKIGIKILHKFPTRKRGLPYFVVYTGK